MELYPDFKELLELLNAHEVDYLIVGGYALALHGAPRFTGDLDIYLSTHRDNPIKCSRNEENGILTNRHGAFV